MKIDFTSIAYLKTGTPVQQQVFHTLKTHRVLRCLRDFTPVVVGTFPLDIAIETSDIDIACQFDVIEVFQTLVQTNFSNYEGFTTTVFDLRGEQTYVANFVLDHFPVEIFAQAIPVQKQYGYRHMCIEYQILKEKDAAFKAEIIALKQAGMKTEPAFAHLLGLTGDPYESLFTYSSQYTSESSL